MTSGPSPSEGVLRAHCRAALRNAGLSQAEACRQLDVSTKHMCQMLTGRSPLTLGWAERILALCGARLVIDVQPAPTGPVTTHAYEGEGPGHACTAPGYGTACGTAWEDHQRTEEKPPEITSGISRKRWEDHQHTEETR